LVFGDQRSDFWQQVVRDLHESLIPILEGSFVFGGRLIVFLSDGVAGRLPEAYPNFMKRASAAFYS